MRLGEDQGKHCGMDITQIWQRWFESFDGESGKNWNFAAQLM